VGRTVNNASRDNCPISDTRLGYTIIVRQTSQFGLSSRDLAHGQDSGPPRQQVAVVARVIGTMMHIEEAEIKGVRGETS
jgi:hypothetical protein